jgi:hypothetical protein
MAWEPVDYNSFKHQQTAQKVEYATYTNLENLQKLRQACPTSSAWGH